MRKQVAVLDAVGSEITSFKHTLRCGHDDIDPS